MRAPQNPPNYNVIKTWSLSRLIRISEENKCNSITHLHRHEAPKGNVVQLNKYNKITLLLLMF